MEKALFIIFVLSFLLQLLYLFLLSLKILFHRDTKNEQGGKVGISVIIAAHNERKNLEKLIPLLLKQKHPDYEIIVSDDRSSDNSLAYLNSIKDPKLKVIRIDRTEGNFNSKKYALTKAINASTKEAILLTDADCVPLSDTWIENMSSCLGSSHQILLGYSGYERRKGFLNLFIRLETFYTALQYFSFALVKKAYMGVGRNLAYLKEVFILNNGFNKFSSATGGDDDLFIGQIANKYSVGVRLDKESQTLSIPKETYSDYFNQKLRHLNAGKKYSVANQFKSALLPLLNFLFYSAFIALLFVYSPIYIPLAIFILRTCVLIVIFTLISRKLGEKIEWFWLPLLDLCYLLYYLMIGIPAIFSKKTKWT